MSLMKVQQRFNLTRRVITFSPVTSRRFGLSLGVNNIPPKHCTYSCIYCQIGRTIHIDIRRKEFYDPGKVVEEVERRAEEVKPEVVTFVPDGEPTLDIYLGEEIRGIKETLDIPVAVITNSSLLFMEEVREALSLADMVSVKVDAVTRRVWKLVNRPHPALDLDEILKGMLEFSSLYSGRLLTETMLVKGINDGEKEAERVASFVSQLDPDISYVAIPIRPPAEPWVEPPDERTLSTYYLTFRETSGVNVELLTGYEGPGFKVSDDPEEYLKATTAVHPIRLDFARAFLREKRIDADSLISRLVEEGILTVIEYRGKEFLARRLPKREVSVER